MVTAAPPWAPAPHVLRRQLEHAFQHQEARARRAGPGGWPGAGARAAGGPNSRAAHHTACARRRVPGLHVHRGADLHGRRAPVAAQMRSPAPRRAACLRLESQPTPSGSSLAVRGAGRGRNERPSPKAGSRGAAPGESQLSGLVLYWNCTGNSAQARIHGLRGACIIFRGR